jgi:subtilase family serine protease
VAPLVVALAIAACNAGGSSNMPGTTGQTNQAAKPIPQWMKDHSATPACAGSRVGQAQCDALVMSGGAHPNIAGWTPADFQTAYKLPSGTNGSGQIVAIVDAYDNPNAASDLAMYRTQFSLGTPNFTKYNQNGQTSNYPSGNHGWGLEEDLDIQMVSASCPKCTIYLIEANSNNWSDLETAENEAVTLGAHIVSNSYSGTGGNESDFDTPGIAYLASAGDSGEGLVDPATFQRVVAVGGTELFKSGSTYTEVVWRDTGGGCSSTSEAKPSWQHDPGCTYRTGNDVGAVAQNAAEYDSYGYGGWITVAGTSISSPLLGGVFGLAGNATTVVGGEKFWQLTKKKVKHELHDITTGNDGTCSPTYLCTDGTGEYKTYGGPTGWGTPNGIKAF